MLDNAKKYEPELVKLFHDVALDPFYIFQQLNFRETFKVPDTTWDGNYFVSLYGDKVIGYIEYSTNRSLTYNAHGLNILHFGTNKKETSNAEYWTFGRDVMTAVKDVFERFGFKKLKFSCVTKNPIMKTYDKLIKRYGGRIVGIYKNERVLIDGKLYDIKEYEITADEYFARKNRKKH